MKDVQEGENVRSPPFAALLSTRRLIFLLLLPLPCPSASTSPGKGLPGGLLEGSCDRRKHTKLTHGLQVGTFMPAQQDMNRASEGGVEKNFDCTHDNR